MKSEGVGIIDRAVSFQTFQPMWPSSTNVTDGQTDRRHANFTLLTVDFSFPLFFYNFLSQYSGFCPLSIMVNNITLVPVHRETYTH